MWGQLTEKHKYKLNFLLNFYRDTTFTRLSRADRHSLPTTISTSCPLYLLSGKEKNHRTQEHHHHCCRGEVGQWWRKREDGREREMRVRVGGLGVDMERERNQETRCEGRLFPIGEWGASKCVNKCVCVHRQYVWIECKIPHSQDLLYATHKLHTSEKVILFPFRWWMSHGVIQGLLFYFDVPLIKKRYFNYPNHFRCVRYSVDEGSSNTSRKPISHLICKRQNAGKVLRLAHHNTLCHGDKRDFQKKLHFIERNCLEIGLIQSSERFCPCSKWFIKSKENSEIQSFMTTQQQS